MATLTQVFTSLADKIRSKLGTTTKYTPAQAISAIDDVYEKGVSEGTTPTQEKTVTAGTSASTVTPDSGYALSKVTVNPTPSQTKSASPSTAAQTISPDSGKLLSSVSISAISPQTGIDGTGPYVYFPYGWWPSSNSTYGAFTRLTQAQAQAAHAHTGTRANVTSNGTIDLGETHSIRYVPVSVDKGVKLVGTYSANTTINISSLGATSKSQFLLVCDTEASGWSGSWNLLRDYNRVLSSHYYPPSITSFSSKSLTLSVGKITNYVQTDDDGHTTGTVYVYLSTKVYFIK